MNIKRAKEEIEKSVRAYLQKDEFGDYVMPVNRQRPILLIGPPGIGKTAIMEQIARDCGITLVSYTITHHTRQSAVGLPYIDKVYYNKEAYSVTKYTLSEIIASIYDKINDTGINEGILFIDEVNCVSETLAPTMLQFLQSKKFGNYSIPSGWVIAAAGNPPEYNKSVREFDVVTLDRVKRINVTADFDVWKEYAYKAGVHSAIMSYLELKRDNFYNVSTTVDGKVFVTARGWEDLSEMLKSYELLGYKVDADFVGEYIQYPEIAADFANYYDLYNKYENDYHIEDILMGRASDDASDKLRTAPFDEKYSVIEHLLGGLSNAFNEADYQNRFIENVYDMLVESMDLYSKSNTTVRADLSAVMGKRRDTMNRQIAASLITGNKLKAMRDAIKYISDVGLKYNTDSPKHVLDEAYAGIKADFDNVSAARNQFLDNTSIMLQNAFNFILRTFGEGQELVMFVTELSINSHAIDFINQEGSNEYTYYAAKFLTDNRQQEIMNDIQSVEAAEQM